MEDGREQKEEPQRFSGYKFAYFAARGRESKTFKGWTRKKEKTNE